MKIATLRFSTRANMYNKSVFSETRYPSHATDCPLYRDNIPMESVNNFDAVGIIIPFGQMNEIWESIFMRTGLHITSELPSYSLKYFADKPLPPENFEVKSNRTCNLCTPYRVILYSHKYFPFNLSTHTGILTF